MKIYKRLASVVLVIVLCMNMGMTALATGTAQTGAKNTKEKELTEEEKKMQKELEAAYKIPTESNSWEGWKKGPGTYGEAAIVMEVSTGAILYAKNIDSKQYPASITKVLTALIALENGDFSDKVTFSHDCVSFLQPGDSSIGLKEGNVITLEQALYAMLLASANEAAYAVGENVGKNAGYDYNWFIEQMNQKVQELGGVNSNFVNTNGLHDKNHYTCARDMALIGRELFKHPEFFKIVQTLEYKIPKSKTVEEHVFQQKDKLLRPQDANYYKYVIGGKTGFTSDALSTLITMAEKDGMQLVCVVLRTHGKNVYPDTTKLLKYAFKNFTKVEVAGQEKSEDVKEILTENTSAKDVIETGSTDNAGSTNNASSISDTDNTGNVNNTDNTESGGYVVLPKKAAFTDLDMELTPDEETEDEATLTYTYHGVYVGSAKAKLSDSYIEAHSVKDDVQEEEEKKEGLQDEESENNTKDMGLIEKLGLSKIFSKLGLSEKTKTDKLILAGASILLVILIVVFIILLIRQRRKRKRRRHR